MLKPLALFSGYGIEIEYMIVDCNSLDVKSIADMFFLDSKGKYRNEIEVGKLRYSNEIALHLLEIKTNGPTLDLVNLPNILHQHVITINDRLQRSNAQLLATGMHPWMDPKRDFQLWPYGTCYAADKRIFNCYRHGWANIQGVHLNLPFANDSEFAKLHAAVRLLLPIIPALTASSPIVALSNTGYLDSRLYVHARDRREMPSITGKAIPDNYSTSRQYHSQLLEKIYREVKEYTNGFVLREEWLNSRGAIARFSRNTVEIRVMDTQEAPIMDIAIVGVLIAVLRALAADFWQTYGEQRKFVTQNLHVIYRGVVRKGLEYVIKDRAYLQAWGLNKKQASVQELWQDILEQITDSHFLLDRKALEIVNSILNEGNLAQRILHALHDDYSQENVRDIYAKLAECLGKNQRFKV